MSDDDNAIYPTHDCFTDAIELMRQFVQEGHERVILVHALCVAPTTAQLLRSLWPGQRFAHAWLEVPKPTGTEAWQRGVWKQRPITYAVSQAELLEQLSPICTWRYTVPMALEMNRQHVNYGPWEPELLPFARTGGRCPACGAVKEYPTPNCETCESALHPSIEELVR